MTTLPAPALTFARDGFSVAVYRDGQPIGHLWRTQTYTLNDWHAETPSGEVLNYTTHTRAVRWLITRREWA